MNIHSRRSVLAAAGLTAAATAMAPVLSSGNRAFADGPTDPNLIYHTGFEDPTDTSWLFSYVDGTGASVPVTSYDSTTPHVGQRCLKYSRPVGSLDDDGKLPYVMAAKTIPSEAGGEYEATVFIRTEGLSSPSAYYAARLGLQTYDADDRWVATYPSSGYMGSGWSMMSVRTPPLATNEVRMEVILYLYRGQTGTVWFDELTVSNVSPPPLTVELNHPSYRGLLIPGDGDTIDLDAQLNTTAIPLAGHVVRMQLTDSAGTVVLSQTEPAAETVSFSEPIAGLPFDTMVLDVDVIDTATQSVVESSQWDIERVNQAPSTYLDRFGRLIRDGAPYFPIGLYASDLRDDTVRPGLPLADLSRLDGGPFTTVLAYTPPDEADLDNAASHGLNVVYAINSFFYDAAGKYHWPDGAVINDADDEVTVITNTVNTYKSHPAMLGWYLGDELNIDFYGDRLIAHQQAVVTNDTDNVTMVNNPLLAMSTETYLRCCDAVSSGAYPIGSKAPVDIGRCGEMARVARESLPHKGRWHVGQAMSWSYYYPELPHRNPTEAELRCMYWQFVVGGATGLFLYQFPLMDDALLTDARVVCGEIAAQVPVILGMDGVRPVTSTAGTAVDWTVREHAGDGYVIAVSTDDSAAQPVTFTADWAMSATEVFSNQTVPVDSTGTLSDTIAPIGVRMYRLTPPTFGTLADLTEAELLRSGKAGARGVATATGRILGRAKTTAASGTAGVHLEDYRDLVRSKEGILLTGETVANLIRLSNALV